MKRPEQIKLLAAVQDLASADTLKRIAATKCLLSAGLREYSFLRKEVLSADETWNRLVQALSDKEEKVVENATGALTQTIGRYRRDPTATDPLRALLTHRNKNIRSYAVRGLGYLPDATIGTTLLPLLKDKTEGVRRETVLVLGRRIQDMSMVERSRVLEVLKHLLPEAKPEMKMILENTINRLSSND